MAGGYADALRWRASAAVNNDRPARIIAGKTKGMKKVNLVISEL